MLLLQAERKTRREGAEMQSKIELSGYLGMTGLPASPSSFRLISAQLHIRVHQTITLFINVNNSIYLGVNIVPVCSVSADTKYFVNR